MKLAHATRAPMALAALFAALLPSSLLGADTSRHTLPRPPGQGNAAATLALSNVSSVGVIPITFNDGDVISADVLNSVLRRINDVLGGFSGPTDLVGSWACKTKIVDANCAVPGFVPTGFGGWREKTQTITFSCTDTACQWTAESFFPGSCQTDFTYARQLTQNYDLSGNQIANKPPGIPSPWTQTYVYNYQKLLPTKFLWHICCVDGNADNAITECVKQNVPPAPVEMLRAAVQGTSVTLTWIPQSTDASGFKVQRRSASTNSWTGVATAQAGATSYTDGGLAVGTYSYRVIATNAFGDAMTSSEVQAVIR